jgi:hypothetical protein
VKRKHFGVITAISIRCVWQPIGATVTHGSNGGGRVEVSGADRNLGNVAMFALITFFPCKIGMELNENFKMSSRALC